MLATPIEQASLLEFVSDPRFVFEQKLDGERVLTRVQDGAVVPLDRSGNVKAKGLPSRVVRTLSTLPGEFVLDGELLHNGEYWLFDLVQAGEVVGPDQPYQVRRRCLEELGRSWQRDSCVALLSQAVTPEEKVALVRAVIEAGGEGIIVRDLDARYEPGRRTPALRKAKFIKTMDVIVTGRGQDGKNNLTIAVYDGDRLVDLNPVTAMAGDGPSLLVGQVCEVRYLYANMTPEGPRLIQVTMPKLRTDKHPSECTLDQARWLSRSVVSWCAT
jgi:ATP-dependent DNA ligase